MRITIAVDDDLVKQAEYYTGINEKDALVREGTHSSCPEGSGPQAGGSRGE
jgi:hypothetical protein